MNDDDESKKIKQDQETLIFIDDMTIPVKNPEVTVREEMEEDGKYILFNAENELILVTNPTGKFILDHCNGSKTVAQIIRDIESEFTLAKDIDLPAIVKEYLLILLKAKLVTINVEGK
ncbi:MAG: hypothetical protein QG657_2456 [Acidobacteriota bacterium]|nr:hypothetical protein [Acidobacteriota bacterium]